MANGNCRQARRLYAEKYPQRITPHHSVFALIHNRLSETGMLKRNSNSTGRFRTVRNVMVEQAILDEIDVHPETSTRIIANTLNISHSSVWRVLKEQQLYPYHIQRVQALLPRDFPQRARFCEWLTHEMRQNPQFLNNVFFTDEAHFSRVAIINFHNNHVWADQNPHEIIEHHFQNVFSVNVWIGIVGDNLIGPHFLAQPLNGISYTSFLQNDLPELLEDIALNIRQNMWFMHDGAPVHFCRTARQHLDVTYPNHWIGRGGPQHWPPRSPELNPCDLCFWGYLKSLVYTTPIVDINDLKNRIQIACDTIRNTPQIFERVRQSMTRRLRSCILARGGHFQHLL
uniref:Uncharacterized protein LOC114344564 n=1 Tax=Diabrotica virgifera virgifera TaxID=50390 RepID=A0A6P7GMR5_DIAVI